jgi:glycerol-3-phosphate dehydrogenase
VGGDAPDFAGQFAALYGRAGVPCEEITVGQARKLEPLLSDKLFTAYRVPDAAIDPFRLALENVNHARALAGSVYHPHTEVLGFDRVGSEIRAARCRDKRSGGLLTIRARQFVNAAGAWAMDIAGLAGCDDVRLLYSKGTLLVSNDRIARHVVNRLRPPDDGDILVPGGTVSLLGTTSTRIDDLENVGPTAAEVDRNIREGAAMIPALAGTRYNRAF